jgi:ABC transporter with metal-binding/Fe-S-binding domain ATP-binding protein
MKVAILFSGGKDSTFSTHVALEQGWDVRCLVTLLPARSDSWMFHHPCAELTKLQAEAMGIRHVMWETAGEKEKELEDMTAAIKSIKDDVDAVVSGAIASRYQKDRIDAVCKELDLRSICPLWGKDQLKLLRDEIDAGLEIVMTAVAAEGLDAKWLGRKIGGDALHELAALQKKFGINPSGEGGEYESFVINAPFFKKKIELGEIEKVWDEDTSSGYIVCKNARLVSK